MEKMRCLRLSSDLGETLRFLASRTAGHIVMAGLLAVAASVTPTGASAQLDEVLRNVMQNAIGGVPAFPGYPPKYLGYPPTGGPSYRGYSTQPAGPPAVPDPRMVAELQRMLDDLGYNAGPADGALGSQTVQALSSFERDHGQPSSGEVSAASLAAVRGVWYEHNHTSVPGSAAIGQAVARPSFDCARAVAPSARTICGSAPLAQLDAEMAAAYVAAKAGLPAEQQAKVAAEQHEWLRRRNGCGADASCLERALAERLGQLQASAATAGTFGIGAAPAVRNMPPGITAPDSAPATIAADQTGDAAAAIARLSQPGEGLRALKFPTLEGLPVFGFDWHLGGDEAAFFHLVALGVRPNLIESDDGAENARQFAQEFLTRPNKYLEQSSTWSGENEFQRDASRRAFLQGYAEKLRQMAPKPPFEFVYAAELTIGPYDANLGGFPLKGEPNLRSLPFGWLQPSPDFKWPELLLPIDKEGAQRLLARLEAARTTNMDNPRVVRLAAVIEAARLDPSSLDFQLGLRRLTLYDDHLTQSLYEFPAPAASPRPAQSFVSRLLAPPAGVMPIRLPVLEGRLILNRDEVSENFRILVALGQFPDLLAERQGFNALSVDRLEGSLVEHFLTPDVQRQLLANPNFPMPEWKGADEFARDRSRQNFEQNYLPKLKELAPNGRFEFAYPTMVGLPVYDAKRGGFALGKIGLDFGSTTILDWIGKKWTPQFEPPDLFCSLDTTNAERLLHQLEYAAARQQALGHSPNSRWVQVVQIVEASRLEPDPNRMALRLKAVELYTQDFGAKLYTFPGIGPEPEPYLASAIPAKLDVPSPAPLDAILLGLKYIEALGDSASDAVYEAFWGLIATRDEAFYSQPDRLVGLAPNDARRPFFPRGGAERTQPAIAAFQKWVKAYAAGLPATAAVATVGMSSAQQDGGYIVEAILGGEVVHAETYAKFLSESHLQADQLVSIHNGNFPSLNIGGATVPILFAMPNRWSLYSFKITNQAFERHPGANPVSVSTFKLGAARLAGDEYGQTVLVIDLTPLSTKVSFGNDTVGSGTYGDIPPLNGLAFTSPSPQAEKPVNGSAFVLDSTLLDLLAAKAVGERLSQQALSYMIERRWLAENKGSAPGGRFFALGKRQPTPEEAVAIAATFIAWARENAPAFPVKVIISGSVEVANDQKTAPWRAIPCLLTNREPVSSEGVLDWARSAIADASRDKAYKMEAGAGWTQRDEEQLAAAEVFAGASQSFYLGGAPSGACGIAPPNFSFPDPAFFAIRITHALPTPSVSALAGKQQLDLTAILDLDTVAFSKRPPSLAELLPPEVLKAIPAIPQSLSQTSAGEYVTFDTRFIEARWRDPGGKEVARLDPEHGDNLDSLSKRYQQRLTKLAADEATPSGPYGLDLVGVRLGMSFEVAEKAIRNHMEVGRVLQGRRDFDAVEKSGQIKPLDSGELFLSADESDAIAILDEPPAAKGRVMAAWRRVLTPEGSAPQANIVIQIEKKYGKPGGFDLDPLKAPYFPVPLSWYRLTGSACTGLYQGWNDRSEPISKTWYQDGRPMTPPLAYILQLKAPPMPDPLFNPLDEQSKRWAQCGPFMEMYLLGGPGAHAEGAPDELDMTLTDIGPYLKAYQESRATLQGSQPGAGSNEAGEQPATAGGIKF